MQRPPERDSDPVVERDPQRRQPAQDFLHRVAQLQVPGRVRFVQQGLARKSSRMLLFNVIPLKMTISSVSKLFHYVCVCA